MTGRARAYLGTWRGRRSGKHTPPDWPEAQRRPAAAGPAVSAPGNVHLCPFTRTRPGLARHGGAPELHASILELYSDNPQLVLN
jgi:hypothetical protein